MDFTKRPIQRGYTNRILCVDVASGKIAAPELDAQVRDYFLGGRSLGLYLLHKATASETKATDPENPLILANGPLGGIPQFPGTAKAMAVSLSPVTGVPGVSNFGGYFGAYLKYAGFDALQVTGQAVQDTMMPTHSQTQATCWAYWSSPRTSVRGEDGSGTTRTETSPWIPHMQRPAQPPVFDLVQHAAKEPGRCHPGLPECPPAFSDH